MTRINLWTDIFDKYDNTEKRQFYCRFFVLEIKYNIANIQHKIIFFYCNNKKSVIIFRRSQKISIKNVKKTGKKMRSTKSKNGLFKPFIKKCLQFLMKCAII